MENQDIEAIKTDLDIQGKIAAVSNTDGGKLLVKTLVNEIIDSIDTMGYKYNSLSITEFISMGAKIRANIDMIQVLNASEGNKEYYQKLLEEALQEIE